MIKRCPRCNGILFRDYYGDVECICGYAGKTRKPSEDETVPIKFYDKDKTIGCEWYDDCWNCPFDKCIEDMTLQEKREFRKMMEEQEE